AAGFPEAVRVLRRIAEWAGGARGMAVPKIATPWLAWLCLALVTCWFWRQGPSSYGRALAAIREDELAARAMGIDVGRHRLTAFVAAGAVAGLYGVLWAYYVRLLAPEDFSFTTAIDGLVMAVVGGSTVWLGPLLGGAFMTSVPEVLRSVGVEAGWIRPFISSALRLVVIVFLPGGLGSLLPRWRTKVPSDGHDAGAPLEHRAAGRALPAAGDTVARVVGGNKD